MRSKLVAICGLVFSLHVSISACAQESDVEQQVLASFDRLVEASASLDTDAYFALFDRDKFSGLNSNGSDWKIVSVSAAIKPAP